MDNIMDDKYELEALKMMQEAETITKLNDWGKRDNIISSLGIALRSIDDIPKVNDSFREMCGSALLGRLCHRLQMENELKLTPKAREVEIKEPLFIIGNPRTGSTLIHKLLSVDPLTRSPFLWEMRTPINETKEKRQDDTIKFCSKLLVDMPVLEVAHPLDPLDVDECIHILDCDMFYIVLMCASPTYAEMFHGQSHSRLTDMYKFHKSAMQLFETQNPTKHENWTFKSPRNTKFLKQIREVYPDAKFLWIHRDPKDVVSSFMMMVEITQGPYRETAQEFKAMLNEKQLGYLVDYLDTAIDVVSEWEKEENSPTVVHCRYSDLKLDPIEMIKKVYANIGRKYTPEFDEKLKQKIETMETQHNATPYSHCLADANLTDEQVTNAFAKYLNSCKGLKFTV